MNPKISTSKSEQIAAEIQRLHDRGSGDWQTLSRQVLDSYETVQYNLPQLLVHRTMMTHREHYLEWSRGTGKTTVMANCITTNVRAMPRSKGIYIAPTYQKVLTEIIPSLIRGLELLGLHHELHYFIGRRPPKSWKWSECYQPPKKYDHFISFWNGSGIQLISQDIPGAGRALNVDYEIGDESALLDAEKMSANTGPTLRGSNMRAFAKSPRFLSKFHATSTPLTPEGQWFLRMEQEAMMKADEMIFLSADCRFNMANLPKAYLENAKSSTIPMIYDAEYLNIRPKVTTDSFYTLLSKEKHGYNDYDYTHYTSTKSAKDSRGDNDLDPSLPLYMGIDWGAAINAAVVCQRQANDFRALKDFFALGDREEIQDDMFAEFAQYYRHHPTKVVFLWYDPTGNHQTGITKGTRAELALKQLSKLGWSVQLMTGTRANPQHHSKHVLWNAILQENNPALPRFRINLSNCSTLYVSMANAKAKAIGNDVKKDKRSERSKKVQRQYATDLSDAIDAPVYGLFYQTMVYGGGTIPDSSTTSR